MLILRVKTLVIDENNSYFQCVRKADSLMFMVLMLYESPV